MKNIVILISGRGSNMQAIVHALQREQWSARVTAVISHKPEAEGLVFAQAQGLATAVVDHKDYTTRETFDAALIGAIERFGADLVVLAGFMRILTPNFVEHYAGRLLNIHPSLLPAFTGLRTHARALEAGCKVAGATVHLVTAALDSGPIVAQAVVPIEPGDTPDLLAQRVLAKEHVIYPRAVRWMVHEELEFTPDGRVFHRSGAPQLEC